MALGLKMFHCLLCDKKFKTKKGLSIHLARIHDVHGIQGRLSIKTIQNFFPLLKKKRWAKAENFLKLTRNNTSDNQWIEGYTHALTGMIAALKTPHSLHEPYIINLGELGNKKLQEVKDKFNDVSNALNNGNRFDSAYFQAWKDYTKYRLLTKE
jgi:hypothetical protein